MTEVVVGVDGVALRVTNLDKVLWPSVGMTKGALIQYYLEVAPALLPHIDDRPLTLHRFPDGVNGVHWYETRANRAPEWLRTQAMYTFRAGKDVCAPVVENLAGLTWAANLAAVELHPFLGVTAELTRPTAVVFDLDPGAPAGFAEAARVALAVRAEVGRIGLTSYAKTSGRRGMHVYVPLNSPATYRETKTLARSIARKLTTEDPEHVTDVMARSSRAGRVFIDWSQNDAGKSTVAPYSLRGVTYPTVSAPVSWDEVRRAASDGASLVFLAHEMLQRLELVGDLFAPVLTMTQAIQPHG
jgi:bifunctional non-homologous end joining protein LigD